MGFTSGFVRTSPPQAPQLAQQLTIVQTGGVTLTLSLAYLTVLAHQRSREQQGNALRAQAFAIQSLIDPIPEPPPPSRSEVAAAQRNTAVEVAKDRWNHEVESAVRWVQNTDWEEVREGLEASAGKLWAKAFGESVGQSEEAVKEKIVAAARTAEAKTETAAGGIAAAAKGAFGRASQSGEKAEAAALETVEEARLRAKSARITAKEKLTKAEGQAKDTATEAKGVIASALDSGREKARQVVGIAKSTVGIAEDKVELKADGQVMPATGAVERALHQRYERPESKHNLTVAEALAERYTPLDKRDNTVLRGL